MQTRLYLPLQHRLDLSRVPLLQSLADTDNRLKRRIDCSAHLTVDGLIVLAEEGAALAVADDHVADVELTEDMFWAPSLACWPRPRISETFASAVKGGTITTSTLLSLPSS